MMLVILSLFSIFAQAHHYKGLPHYSYFDNYPQVPVLEFIGESPQYELFVTVYNFQGLNLKEVDSPDDVRFYIYIHDVIRDKSYRGDVDFAIYSKDNLLFQLDRVEQEQESLFILQKKIEASERLKLTASLTTPEGKKVLVSVPISIRPSFLETYGLPLAVVLFFVIVALVKLAVRGRTDGKGKKVPRKRALATEVASS